MPLYASISRGEVDKIVFRYECRKESPLVEKVNHIMARIQREDSSLQGDPLLFQAVREYIFEKKAEGLKGAIEYCDWRDSL